MGEIGAGSMGFVFLAGILSTLSPCVLPLLPLVLAGAASAHRFGMVALAVGLVPSFVGVWGCSSRPSASRSDWMPVCFASPMWFCWPGLAWCC